MLQIKIRQAFYLFTALTIGGNVMMTLYAAIGNFVINSKGLPIVFASNKEYALTTHELLIWSGLAFRILTYQELRRDFYEKEQELHLTSELDFDHYLNRLIMRQLIVFGKDCTGVDALYNLLEHLHLQPVPSGFFVRTLTFFKLWILKGFSFRDATSSLHCKKLLPFEKQVIRLLRCQSLSTTELIQYTQKSRAQCHKKTVYANQYENPQVIPDDTPLAAVRLPVLTTIANLYFKQQILFYV